MHSIFKFFDSTYFICGKSGSLGLEFGSFSSGRLLLLGLSSSLSFHLRLAILLLLLLYALLSEHFGLLALLLRGFNFLFVFLEFLLLCSLDSHLLILLLLAFDLATDHVVCLELDAVRKLYVENGSLISI